MKLFETHGIKKLIEFKWPLIFKYTLLKLFIPFLIYLTLYMTFMHTMVYIGDTSRVWYTILLEATLIAISGYFLVIETYQLSNAGLSYFSSFWNYLDCIPPIMLVLFIAFA